MAEAEQIATEQATEPTPAEAAETREQELGDIFDKANAEESGEGQTRDEQGRFASNTSAGDTVADIAPEGAAAETTESTDQDAEVGGEPVTVLDPPASWSDAAKAGWSGLTRELQDEVLKREVDWQKADGERVTKLKGYEPIDAALAPVLQHLQMSGLAPGQYVSQLVAADQALKNPQTRDQAMQWVAQQYGIDLSQQQQAAPEVDPALAPFVQEINDLKGQVANFVESQQVQETARVNGEIEAFAKDRPHFEEVRQQMGALMNAGAASDMASAYDMAVWANPTTRAKVQAEESAEAEAKRKAESEEKAAKARRVSQTNLTTQGTAGGSTPPQYKDREEELGAIYDRATGA